MTGVELYVRDNTGYYCYKQRHGGNDIVDYVQDKGDNIFNMSAQEVIKEFHDTNFKRTSDYNFHSNGSPLEYGVKIPQKYVTHNDKFFGDSLRNCIYSDIENYINDNFNGEDDENNIYSVGYSDYVVYVDLINKKIEGLDDEDEDEDENDDDEETQTHTPYKYLENFNKFINKK